MEQVTYYTQLVTSSMKHRKGCLHKSLEKLSNETLDMTSKAALPSLPKWDSQSTDCRELSLNWWNPIFKNIPTLMSPSKQWIWDLIDPVIKSPSVWAICLPAFLAVLVILQKLLSLLLPSQHITNKVKDDWWLSITL